MANEKRLIDANALAEQVDNLCADWNENWIGNDNQSFILHSDVSDLISDAPTVDAVEVVHGRWLTLEEYAEKIGADPTGHMGGWRFCPECGQPMRELYGWAYCPNCGAKMDGDGNA